MMGLILVVSCHVVDLIRVLSSPRSAMTNLNMAVRLDALNFMDILVREMALVTSCVLLLGLGSYEHTGERDCSDEVKCGQT